MKNGRISQWDSTTTNPPHWSGDMYQEQLNRPTTHWCQPLPPPPPHPPSSHYLSFTVSCVSRPGANGAKNYHSPSLQSHTTYLWNLQPITQVKSILQNLTPTCTLPARSTSCHTTRGSMWPPLNASGEGSPHTANGVSNPMQQFQGTCACTHMYQWNHTCPPSNTTNGTSGTFSPHSKWTYYLAVPPPPHYLSFTEGGG